MKVGRCSILDHFSAQRHRAETDCKTAVSHKRKCFGPQLAILNVPVVFMHTWPLISSHRSTRPRIVDCNTSMHYILSTTPLNSEL